METTVSSQSFVQTRIDRNWPDKDSGSFEAFKDLVSQQVDAAQWPLAASVHKNVLVYDGDAVRQAASTDNTRLALMAEWSDALLIGPGVFAIRQALPDGTVIDRATDIFEALIDEEKRTKSGGGDHFAKPGANDRVWNVLQKHCLADPENFARYFSGAAFDLACRAWLGDGYQMTAQVNRVNPGGAAQVGHRDYHLGFMTPERMMDFPSHVHHLSPMLTLQAAVAHCDMPLETGPTQLLPFSQKFFEGYFAFSRETFQAYFEAHSVQLALKKGDAVFFNPALMHAAGANTSKSTYRMANLMQISSALGRSLESVDRVAMALALYPVLLAGRQSGSFSEAEVDCAIAACAEGYAFPTNLDNDPPVGGLSPMTQAQRTKRALAEERSVDDFADEIRAHAKTTQP